MITSIRGDPEQKYGNTEVFVRRQTGVCITQGVYNCLLLVPIVGGACFQRHQLAAILMHHLVSFR